MTSSAVALTNVQNYLAQGDYARALGTILREADIAVADKVVGKNKAQRKAALAKAVANYDVETLAPLQELMQNYVDNIARIELTEARELTVEEKRLLMTEHESLKPIQEFLESRRDDIREMAFAGIDAELAAGGVENPATTSGKLVVAELGKKFCKEGAGYKDPSLDHKKLLKLLGDDAKKVVKVEHVPATTVTTFSEEKLMELAQEKPEVMELIRQALIPGAPKSPRFQVRPLSADDLAELEGDDVLDLSEYV